MTASDTIVRAVAATLPVHSRSRYREEWLADLAGADELGLARATIVGGALVTSATIDRTDPHVSGMPRPVLAARRGRWAGLFLGTSMVLGIGGFFLGGSLGTRDAAIIAGIGTGLQLIAFAAGAVGLLLLAAALVAAFGAAGARGLVMSAGIVAGGVLLIVLAMLSPVFGMLSLGATAAAFVVVLAIGRTQPGAPSTLPRGRRIVVALPFSLATLAVGGLGLAHILIWNPLAKLPGMTLDEIYAGMAAAGEGTGAVLIIAWTTCWTLGAVALPVIVALPVADARLSARGIAAAGFILIGATVFGQWFAGFGMGMGIADAFMTTGGDTALTGPMLALVGQAALVASLVAALPPRRLQPVAAGS